MKRIILNILFMLMAVTASAQALPSLLVGSNPEGFSTGSATVAWKPNAYALENNVAAMSFADGRMDASVSFGMWQPEYANDKVIGAGTSVKTTDKLAFGLTFKYLSQESYEIMTEGGTASREGLFTPKEFNVAVGASYAIVDFLSLGITARVLHSSLAPEIASTIFGADFGAYFKMNGITAGLSVNNIGTNAKYGEYSYRQPMMAKLGVGYEMNFNKSSVAVSAEGDILFSGAFMAGAGVEYSFRDFLSVRAGYHYGDKKKAVPSYASIGLGLKFFGVHLDAAYLIASGPLRNTFSIGLGYSF